MPMTHYVQDCLASTVEDPRPRPQRSLRMRTSLGVLPSERSADRDVREKTMLHRHSSPAFDRGSSASSLSAKVLPENMLMQTNVSLPGLATRDGHCVFLLEVDTGFGVHVIHKRYSEIRDFRTTLLQALRDKIHCGYGPCAQLAQLSQIKFPRRRLRLPGFKHEADFNVAQTRMPLLERFLQGMLRVYRLATRRQMRVCNNSCCSMLGLIQHFLNVAKPVLSVQDEDPTVVEISAVYKHALAVPYTDVAWPTLGDDKPVPLFAIAEVSEPVAVSD